MKRFINIVHMEIEDYMEKYGERYEDGELFDYPLEELDYILNDTDIENLAIIDDRLYEIG